MDHEAKARETLQWIEENRLERDSPRVWGEVQAHALLAILEELRAANGNSIRSTDTATGRTSDRST